jgi:hypothetical protein
LKIVQGNFLKFFIRIGLIGEVGPFKNFFSQKHAELEKEKVVSESSGA